MGRSRRGAVQCVLATEGLIVRRTLRLSVVVQPVGGSDPSPMTRKIGARGAPLDRE